MSQVTRILMHGCNGHMGQVITALAKEDPSLEIVAGVDVADHRENGYPVFTSLADCQIQADVMIDFSSFRATDQVVAYCQEEKLPLVLCTTGLTPDQLARVGEASKETAILRSANMSLGINLLLQLLKEAAQILAPAGFDMEIEERHHRLKCDAPSGTALALADSLNEALGGEYHYTYDRSQRHQQRDPKEIGISALRGGNIVGQHDVLFAGTDEVIEFKHTAYSKAVFGKGALEAAKFLAGKGAGLYDMSDVIAHR